VAAAYLDEHEDAKETKRAVEKEGRRCILLSVDVDDSEFCRDAVEKTVDEFGKLDILVNNAAFQASILITGDEDRGLGAGQSRGSV
jgi:NAD(P)-dependent dehydrogenase (short-subunit alcohol dehydrogenase family)